jgi:hypothetical protein
MSPLPWTVSEPVPVRINGEASFCANVLDAEGRPVAVGVDLDNAIAIASAVNAAGGIHPENQPQGTTKGNP